MISPPDSLKAFHSSDHRRLNPSVAPASILERFSKDLRAFTLIELLIVVAIIGILASLLLSAMGGMKMAGLRAKSMGNLRQTAAAFYLYSQDNNGYFPRGMSDPWMYYLYPYVNTTNGTMTSINANDLLPRTPFISPGVTPSYMAKNASNYVMTNSLVTRCYGYNIDLPIVAASQTVPSGGQRATNIFNPKSVPKPSLTCLLMTGMSWTTGVGENIATASQQYGGQIQVAYLDGHVQAMETNAVPMAKNGFKAADYNVFWYGFPAVPK